MPAFGICVNHPMKAGVQEPWIGTLVHSTITVCYRLLIPDDGYRLRNSLIECDPELDEKGIREESYRNDSFVMKQNRKAAEIGNSIRTNTAKNGFRLCAGVSLMIGVRYIGKALVLLASN